MFIYDEECVLYTKLSFLFLALLYDDSLIESRSPQSRQEKLLIRISMSAISNPNQWGEKKKEKWSHFWIYFGEKTVDLMIQMLEFPPF